MQSRIKYWLVALQAAFVLMIAAMSDRLVPFAFSRPMAAAGILWSVGLIIVAGRVGLGALRAGTGAIAPLAKAELPIVIRAAEWALLLGFALALHGWAKSMLPGVTSFWADPMLADLDHAIFGTDPWRLVRSGAFNELYANTYIVWFPITFGTMALLAFSRRDHSILFNSYLAILIVGGTIGQYVLPSAGPIFFERIGLGPRFAELVATNHANYNVLADYLWRHYSAGDAALGTGISAMPSMHVANAAWTLFAAYRLRPSLVVPAGLYVLVIWAASIASGWHYMTDGLAGLVMAIVLHLAMVRLSKGPAIAFRDEPLPQPA